MDSAELKAYINDVMRSNDPRLRDKSETEKKRIAVGAYYAMKARKQGKSGAGE